MSTSLLNWQRGRTLVLLFVVLTSIYMMTYSGRVESGDTRRYLNAVSSLVNYGDYNLDLAAVEFLPETFDKHLKYPLQAADVEPLQVFLAAPLYLLARSVPGIGLIHTLYLFNVLVSAAAGCVLFLYAVALGYSERTAVLGALAFGVGTVIFPYSKTFFREPLTLLALLTCGLLLERLRQRKYRSLPLLVGAIIAIGTLLLAKAAALLALPALLVVALPNFRQFLNRRVLIAGGIVVVLVAGIFLFLSTASGLGSRYNLLHLLDSASSSYFTTALQAYLLSIGGSIWGTSPMILLALPGSVLLLRRGQPRYPLAMLLLVSAFALGYAALNGIHWFGGLSWPPRFLVPIVAFLMVGTFPVIERMQQRLLWAIGGLLLFIYSLWVQISGVTLIWSVYTQALPPEAHGLLEWGPGLNELRYLRWVLIPGLWRTVPLDIAWTIIHTPGVIVALATLAAVSAAALFRSVWRKMVALIWVVGLPVALLAVIGIGLHLLYLNDPRYLASDDTLAAILPIIQSETNPQDVVLLGSPRYEPFFSNAAKLRNAARVIGLPQQPGEQPSPEQPPKVRSDNPAVLLTKDTIRLIYNLAATRSRLWLLEDGGPDLPWSVRPVERFLSAHYYPIRVIETGPLTRLIEYSTISAPDMFAYREPEHLTDLVYDHQVHLAGFDLPVGETNAPGGVLAISLYWKTDAAISANYTVGLYLRDANGAPVAQVDSQPGGGFFPTSQWQSGVPVWDNRAIRLPADLAPGDYQLWLKVYGFAPDGSVQDLAVTTGQKIDNSVGVLPVTIHVQ